jgi:hypothetical protein
MKKNYAVSLMQAMNCYMFNISLIDEVKPSNIYY